MRLEQGLENGENSGSVFDITWPLAIHILEEEPLPRDVLLDFAAHDGAKHLRELVINGLKLETPASRLYFLRLSKLATRKTITDDFNPQVPGGDGSPTSTRSFNVLDGFYGPKKIGNGRRHRGSGVWSSGR